MHELGHAIVPFIEHFYSQVHPAFDPIAYTPLPPVRGSTGSACTRT